jgi:hypothetical protein
MHTLLSHPAILLISLSTASGILLHDTRLDSAQAMSVSLPAVMANYEVGIKFNNFGTDSHIHNEESSTAQVISELKTPSPRLQPRSNEDRKYLLQKYAARGYHSFDNYNLPLA